LELEFELELEELFELEFPATFVRSALSVAIAGGLTGSPPTGPGVACAVPTRAAIASVVMVMVFIMNVLSLSSEAAPNSDSKRTTGSLSSHSSPKQFFRLMPLKSSRQQVGL
jgi:hypothetical protein